MLLNTHKQSKPPLWVRCITFSIRVGHLSSRLTHSSGALAPGSFFSTCCCWCLGLSIGHIPTFWTAIDHLSCWRHRPHRCCTLKLSLLLFYKLRHHSVMSQLCMFVSESLNRHSLLTVAWGICWLISYLLGFFAVWFKFPRTPFGCCGQHSAAH